jgi:O-antigen/teichoic acid export membrane protein
MIQTKKKTSQTAIEGDNRQLSLKANMLWNSAGSMVNLGCQWLLTIFVVRLSNGYDAAGVLSLAMSIYNIFAPLAIYRMYTYQVTDVRRENALGEYFAFRIITVAIAAVCCIIYTVLTGAMSALSAVVAYVFFKAAGLLIDVFHGEDQLNARMDYIGKSLMMQGACSLATFCAVFYFSDDLTLAIFAMSLATVAIGLFFDFPRTRRIAKVKFGISKNKALHLLVYCFPIVLASIACSAAPSIPKQMLAYVQNESALGIFTSVAAPVAIVQMGASYIYNPLLDRFAKYYDQADKKGLTALFSKASIGIAFVGGAAIGGFALFGSPILQLLFGESILEYTYLLLPAIGAAIITAYVWFVNDLLVAIRCFRGSVIGNVSALACTLISSYPMIMEYGMNGVNFCGILSYACGLTFMLIALAIAVSGMGDVRIVRDDKD